MTHHTDLAWLWQGLVSGLLASILYGLASAFARRSIARRLFELRGMTRIGDLSMLTDRQVERLTKYYGWKRDDETGEYWWPSSKPPGQHWEWLE